MSEPINVDNRPLPWAVRPLQVVANFAKVYGLRPELVCAVIEQESGWNQWAVRFEPAFLTRYIHPAIPTAPSTLELTKAMSFGLMQVMGETAVEMGFNGKYLTALCNVTLGIQYGCLKLLRCYARAGGNDRVALQLYNGGGNLSYADEVLARVQNYVGKIPASN